MRDIPDIKLGTVLFSIAEATPGFEKEYNRWYERDHFFAGCMIGPNFFSGRRWVAPKTLKTQRFPAHTPITSDIHKGSFLHTYWILDGTYSETLRWSVDQVQQLYKQKRMEPPRENISTAFYRYDSGVFRDADGVPAEMALEYPYEGVAVTMIDRAANVTQTAFEAWLKDTWLPHFMAKSPIAQTLILRPQEMPADAPANVPRPNPDEYARRYLLLSFMEENPIMSWATRFQSFDSAVSDSGFAKVVYAAAFIPTLPGTDKYINEL